MEIQCRCGAVCVAVNGPPTAQFFCHCDDCQAVHGAAYVPVSIYPADSVRVTRGAPKCWTLRTTPRATCPECGTRIFAEALAVGLRAVTGSLLPAGTFEPRFHMQCQHAVRPVLDGLPHFKGFPPAFGGSDEIVSW
jgi:hypothetical protein